jgi:hypothetical protein
MNMIKENLAFVPCILVIYLAATNNTPATFDLFGYSVVTEITWLLALSCVLGYASGIITAHMTSRSSIRRRLCEARRLGKLNAVFTSLEATKELESIVGPLDR